MDDIADATTTGSKLKALVAYQSTYPADIQGQQQHFGKPPSEHQEFETHLEATYSHQELQQLRDSINTILGEETDDEP